MNIRMSHILLLKTQLNSFSERNGECTGDITPPVGVPVTGGVTLVNVADFVHLIGGGAICYKNSLPSIPLLPVLGL